MMMLSEALNSDTIFNELKEVAQGPLLPQVTVSHVTDSPPQQTKHPLIMDDATSMQPPAKRVCPSLPFHRIPCKARGLSNKHNSDTAFFDIPVDAPHGLLLSCSHHECVESGRRFRYCKVCELPVAKRNFPKRHGHGLIHSAKDLKEVDYICGFVDTTSDEAGSCHPCEEDGAFKVMEKPRHRRVVSVDVANQFRSQQSASSQRIIAQPMENKSILDLSVSEKEWLKLLHHRPDLEEESMMSIWMDKIISFAEEKDSAPSRAQPVAPAIEQTHFTPCSLPDLRDTNTIVHPSHSQNGPVSAATAATYQLGGVPTSSPQHAVSPSTSIAADLSLFAGTKEQLSSIDRAPMDQILQNLQRQARMASDVSEFASALDNVDITNFFE